MHCLTVTPFVANEVYFFYFFLFNTLSALQVVSNFQKVSGHEASLSACLSFPSLMCHLCGISAKHPMGAASSGPEGRDPNDESSQATIPYHVSVFPRLTPLVSPVSSPKSQQQLLVEDVQGSEHNTWTSIPRGTVMVMKWMAAPCEGPTKAPRTPVSLLWKLAGNCGIKEKVYKVFGDLLKRTAL